MRDYLRSAQCFKCAAQAEGPLNDVSFYVGTTQRNNEAIEATKHIPSTTPTKNVMSMDDAPVPRWCQ